MTERLTIKRNNGDCVLKAESCCYGWYSFDVQESLRKEGTEILKKAIYKLAEYETAEEQGRLVVLPKCNIGDTVYIPIDFQNKIYTGTIEGFEYARMRDTWVVKIRTDDAGTCYEAFEDFGKTIFLIREEAEKALKEMEKDE